jgi:hypothetical protein
MTGDLTRVIIDLIERLNKDIELTRAFSLDHTAHLLSMAKLDLQTELYAISDQELRALTLAIADGVKTVAGPRNADRGSAESLAPKPE